MNIRTKLAVAAAVALPVSGLAVVGGGVFQAASAGGPPTLSCSSVGADPANTTGGVTFDNGSGPATGALDLGASINTTGLSTIDEDGLAIGQNVVVMPAEAIAGQTLTLANSQVVTVVSDTTQKLGVAGAKNFETATFAPAATSVIAKKSAVTINPSTTGSYSTLNSGLSVTSGSPVVTATASGTFTNADVGQPVQVTFNDTEDSGYYSPFSYPSDLATPTQTAQFISAVNGTGTEATISEYETPVGETAATESANSEVSDPVVVTIGSTSQSTNTVGTDYDFALTGCAIPVLSNEAGVIYPTNVTFTNNGPVSNPSSALALEGSPQQINNANINFPNSATLPSGYAWGDGGEDSATVSFDSTKDSLNLGTDTESFVDGVVPSGDPYTTSKASLSFGVGSLVLCTTGQLQAIGTGNGSHLPGSGIDDSSIAAATSTGSATTVKSVAYQELHYCDGGIDSAISGASAFGELAVVEADPNGGGAGSDGTGLGALIEIGGSGSAIL